MYIHTYKVHSSPTLYSVITPYLYLVHSTSYKGSTPTRYYCNSSSRARATIDYTCMRTHMYDVPLAYIILLSLSRTHHARKRVHTCTCSLLCTYVCTMYLQVCTMYKYDVLCTLYEYIVALYSSTMYNYHVHRSSSTTSIVYKVHTCSSPRLALLPVCTCTST